MKALIDADLVAYINAASANNDPLEVAITRVDQLMHNILEVVHCDTYSAFLSGANNFRKIINPEYKSNRKDKDPPVWLQQCREHLVTNWKAVVTDGYEADDALGIEQYGYRNEGYLESTIICSIDKDLNQIPGLHYSWPILRNGLVVRGASVYEISEVGGLQHFYKQMLIGDTADNIKGVNKIGPVKASKIIDPLNTEEEMYQAVCKLYRDIERFDMNADCLWIMRNERETFTKRGFSL